MRLVSGFSVGITLLAVLVLQVNGSVCPCGLQGADCSELVEDVEVPLNGSCGKFSSCEVENGTAVCSCVCGSTGEFCENHRKGTTYNYVIGYVVPILLIAAILQYYKRRAAAKNDKEFLFSSAEIAGTSSTRIPKSALFIYRFAILVFILFVQIYQLERSGLSAERAYSAYTIWNFTVLIVYFAIGSYISFKSMMSTLSETGEMTRLQKLHLVLMEVELPCSLLVVVVFWGLLVPTALSSSGSTQFLFNFESFVQHGANFFFMLLDFFLSRYRFTGYHVIWMLLLPLFYLIFHVSRLKYFDDNDFPHCAVYAFLDMESPLFGAWLVGLTILHMLFFYGMTLFAKCKPAIEYKEDCELESVSG